MRAPCAQDRRADRDFDVGKIALLRGLGTGAIGRRHCRGRIVCGIRREPEHPFKLGQHVVDEVLARHLRIARALAAHAGDGAAVHRAAPHERAQFVFDHVVELFEDDDLVKAVHE